MDFFLNCFGLQLQSVNRHSLMTVQQHADCVHVFMCHKLWHSATCLLWTAHSAAAIAERGRVHVWFPAGVYESVTNPYWDVVLSSAISKMSDLCVCIVLVIHFRMVQLLFDPYVTRIIDSFSRWRLSLAQGHFNSTDSNWLTTEMFSNNVTFEPLPAHLKKLEVILAKIKAFMVQYHTAQPTQVSKYLTILLTFAFLDNKIKKKRKVPQSKGKK